MSSFFHISGGRQTWQSTESLPRHSHNKAYMALVLSGSYDESGSRGRFHVGPGDVLVHDAFDSHLDRFQIKGAHILNLMVTDSLPSFGIGRVDDPDAIARAAELDLVEAGARLFAQLREVRGAIRDWPDILAADILRDSNCRLESWALMHGLAFETISRGFGRAFGVTPAAFRAEVRARRAFKLIIGGNASLVSIAADTGFADQAHMSRAIRALTGSPPSSWRKSSLFKTGDVTTA